MKAKPSLIKVSLCGPGDVAKELEIAKSAIIAWNAANYVKTGYGLDCLHWSTHSAPDAGTRAQQAINQQMLDQSDLVIAVFWRRLGTPTGLAESGTVEEVQRAVARGVRVMIYFSDLEAPSSADDDHQYEKLQAFRKRVMANGLAATFSSRRKFESIVAQHLELAVAALITTRATKKKATKKAAKKRATQSGTTISQSGNNNTQIVGDGNTFNAAPPPPPKVVIGPLPGQISPKEQFQVTEWLDKLADLCVKVKKGKNLGEWKAEWRSRLLKKFKVPRYNALMSDQMPAVKQWYLMHEGMLVSTRKGKRTGAAATKWKTAIKTKMGAMGRTNEDYYPKLAKRLKIDPFTSLTDLSDDDLGRAYRMVSNDAKKSKT